jgi:CelD/BcsL family acetyltransferase involved in cellulose biosynthesis
MAEGRGNEISVHDAVEPLEPEWDELARGAPPFLQPGWIAAWWNAFGEGELIILSVRRDGRLVGVLPLARRHGVLHSTTNWHSPLYGAVTEDRAAGQALAEALFQQRARRVHLNFLAGDAPFNEDFRAAADASGHRLAERVVMRSPYVELTGDWETYWRSRSRNMRKGLRRRRNRLEELGEVSVEVAAGEEALGRLDEAFALEVSGWKGREGTAIISRPETKRFYEEVARWAAEKGTLRLATLRLDDRALAMHLSIEAGDDYFTLKVGYEAEFEKLAPSKVLDQEMIEYAFTSKLSSFELLGDADPYKLDWADELHERIELQAFTRSPLGLLEGLVQTHGRALARRAIAIRKR